MRLPPDFRPSAHRAFNPAIGAAHRVDLARPVFNAAAGEAYPVASSPRVDRFGARSTSGRRVALRANRRPDAVSEAAVRGS